MLRLRVFFMPVLLILVALSGAACSCGDDDDDGDNDVDDDVADDDTAADDDTGDDDTSPDDDNADDDDVDDDDADDDDTGDDDFENEPLAVADCDAACVAIDEDVNFDASASTDPNGETLTFAWDFGDGGSASGASTTHAFDAAGAYRVTLTATNESGLSDESTCVVGAGDFPVVTPAIDAIDFSPNRFDPAIIETGDKPTDGGLVYGFFVAPQNTTPDAILVNGLNGHPGDAPVSWCELTPPSLNAGDVGIVRCHSYDPAFNAGESVTLAVMDGATTIWTKTATIPAPSLTPSLITASVDGKEILVHVRNDADKVITLTDIDLNGQDITHFAVVENAAIAPGAHAIVRIVRCDTAPLGERMAFTVRGTDAAAATHAVTRSLRLHQPIFPVGNWNGSSGDVFTDDEALQQQLDVGIDMFIWNPNAHDPDDVLPRAEAWDFYLFTHRGDVSGDQTYLDFVADHGDNPRILTNAVSGEADIGGEAIDELPDVQLHREIWPADKPLWVYNACSYEFPAFAPLADLGGMDHYCVFAPKCNINLPPGFWDRIEIAGAYAEQIKYAAEPNPAWNWTQTMWNTNLDDDVFIRCTSDEEIRAQWYQVISAGTKGILWFIFRDEVSEQCGGQGEDEMLRLRRELDQIKLVLLEGEMTEPGAFAASADDTIDVSVTLAAAGAVLFVTNLDYDLNLVGPWTWHEKANVEIAFTPPAGFEPLEFRLLNGNAFTELAATRVSETEWRITLPALAVAQAIAIVWEP
ncbi:PKD domain-containing protein [bacterium]|nr:PKD domain-containing protein [bacterium]